MTPDYTHWAKKFDKVKHIYCDKPETGTLCGSVAHCLGNNYATKEMEVCPECLKVRAKEEDGDEPDYNAPSNYERQERQDFIQRNLK